MKARVTLKESLSLNVGDCQFRRDVPVIITDRELIGYVENNPWFVVERLGGEEKKSKKGSHKSRSTGDKPSDGQHEGTDEAS